MPFGYVFLILILALLVWDSVKAIRQKKWLRALVPLFALPMFVFFAAELYYGGSADKDAARLYADYIPGHFYVMEHGNYKEVSAAVFHRMQVLETVGRISLVAAAVCGMLSFFIEKPDK